ncbi:MAG TPA: hypothetical protein VGS20_09650 [Candidatus Acidoferrales bacterium]|nr:hypothetical protein [Candidatus Acidoferrales bacterium]
MNATMQKLVELQTLDLRLAGLRRQIEAFPGRLAEIERQLQAARDAVSAATRHVTDLHKNRKTLELDVEDWREKIRKYKEQLYQVKTNEAYKALQEEIRNAEGEMSRAEDRLLEQMVGDEEADRQVKEARRALAEAEISAKAERERLLAEQAGVEKEHSEVEAAAKAHLADLPEELVDHYRRIARRHGGVALAAAREECCSMCSVRIRPHVMQMLRQAENSEIIHCETCTRILYYEEKKEAPAAQTSMAEAGNA